MVDVVVELVDEEEEEMEVEVERAEKVEEMEDMEVEVEVERAEKVEEVEEMDVEVEKVDTGQVLHLSIVTRFSNLRDPTKGDSGTVHLRGAPV